jgi:multicomponent Na+:H+ antiporter subunit E
MNVRLTLALPVAVVLTVTWVLLQGEWSAGNVLGGLLLAIVIVVAFPPRRRGYRHRIHPVAFVRFIAFVLYSLVLSSWAVIMTIVRPTPTNLRSGIVTVRLESDSPLTTTIVANAITLTPGTMTLTARTGPAELNVHVLGLDDADAFRASVADLERRVLAACEPSIDADSPEGLEPWTS